MSSSSATIAALATAPAAGAVGILRLSGPAALEVGRRLVPGVPAEPTPRHAYLASFVDAEGRLLDEGFFLYFRAPHSFTGEDVVELQAHGGPRLLQLLLGRVLPQAGAEEESEAPQEEARQEGRKERTARGDQAGQLQRTVAVDVIACVRSGGRRRVLAYEKEVGGVRGIVEHLGLPTACAKLAPARGPHKAAWC